MTQNTILALAITVILSSPVYAQSNPEYKADGTVKTDVSVDVNDSDSSSVDVPTNETLHTAVYGDSKLNPIDVALNQASDQASEKTGITINLNRVTQVKGSDVEGLSLDTSNNEGEYTNAMLVLNEGESTRTGTVSLDFKRVDQSGDEQIIKRNMEGAVIVSNEDGKLISIETSNDQDEYTNASLEGTGTAGNRTGTVTLAFKRVDQTGDEPILKRNMEWALKASNEDGLSKSASFVIADTTYDLSKEGHLGNRKYYATNRKTGEKYELMRGESGDVTGKLINDFTNEEKITVNGDNSVVVDINSDEFDHTTFHNDGTIEIGEDSSLLAVNGNIVDAHDLATMSKRERQVITQNVSNTGTVIKHLDENDYNIATVTATGAEVNTSAQRKGTAQTVIATSTNGDKFTVTNPRNNHAVLTSDSGTQYTFTTNEDGYVNDTHLDKINGVDSKEYTRNELQQATYTLNMVDSHVSDRVDSILSSGETGTWAKINYTSGQQKGSYQHADTDSYGATIGYDTAVTNSLTVGGAFTYADNSIDYNTQPDSESDNYLFTVYGYTQFAHNNFLEANGTYSYADYDMDNVTGSNPNGNSYNVRAAFGHQLKFDKKGSLIVKGVYNYSHAGMDTYEQSGLEYDTNDLSKSEFGLSANYQNEFILANKAKLIPSVSVSYMHDVNGNENYTTISGSDLLGISADNIYGENSDQRFNSEIGVSYVENNFSTKISWAHNDSGDYHDQSANLTLLYTF